MIEEKLESLRKEYLKIRPPVYLVNHGWQDLAVKLGDKKTVNVGAIFGRSLAFACLVILLFGSVVGIAQAAKPGDALYPVKLAADEAFAKVSGKPEIKVERRAQDIIDVSNESQEQLDEAAREFQKSLEDAKKSEKDEEFAETLDEQEKKFRKAQEDNPNARDRLEEAIKQTQRIRGEVKGKKTKNSDEKDKSSNSHNDKREQDHQGDNHSDR